MRLDAPDETTQPEGAARSSQAGESPPQESVAQPGNSPFLRSPFSATIPRQHGAWSILLVGYAVGVACASRVNGWAAVVLLVAVVLGFIARHAAVTYLRIRDARRAAVGRLTVVYGLLALGAALALVLGFGLLLLIPIGVVGAVPAGISTVLERKRLDRTAIGEIIGIIGLSTVVIAAGYCASGTLGARELGVWGIGTLFFCASVPHVRYLVRFRPTRETPFGERLSAGSPSLLFHVVSIAIVGWLGQAGVAPSLAFVALVPIALKALLPVLRPPTGEFSIKRIGFVELGHSVLFAVLMGLVYGLG
ncbi:MAG TPA: YwiC-like family protein [Armatimonadota bacterium]|nr:YwiC-like family protein [Armatimonadota bacterium]